MNLDRIVRQISDNLTHGREKYDGLTSAEIGHYNRALMFGPDDEAFPDQDEWSAWVD